MKLIIDNCIAQKRHRHTKRGMVYDPSSKDKKIAIQQIKEQFDCKPFTHALRIRFRFSIKRPKSHYKKGKNSKFLTPKAPLHPTGRIGVIDNFIKFYLDVMNKIVYLDDSQVIEVSAVKEYNDEESYTWIKI